MVVIRTKDGTELFLVGAPRRAARSVQVGPTEARGARRREWLGKKEGREGQQYDAWHVAGGPDGTEPDWDSIAEVGEFDKSPRSEW